MKKVLAVQVPAPCPLACEFCRTPNHNEGDMARVRQSVVEQIGSHDEIYITSNGETGLSSIFPDLVSIAQQSGKSISVLCATEKSVVAGLCRVEISLNKYTEPLALRAIEKAKCLSIPIVLSVVDEGNGVNKGTLLSRYGVDGILVRAQQHEGRSNTSAGESSFLQRVGSSLGLFPAIAYRELTLLGEGFRATCIDHQGDIVPVLGTPA